jgi:UDP-2-acetamido-2,6-beta-L-arabino-hexul-4-ose reductase
VKVLVTGSNGFIGRNLLAHLSLRDDVTVLPISRASTAADLAAAVNAADFVFHVAGVNRPVDSSEFQAGNVGSTEVLCKLLLEGGRKIPVVYTSSTQADRENAYGLSKLAAEQVLRRYQQSSGAAVHLFRLPNVFGKWCRPNYNSAIATFCYNVGRGLPIKVSDPEARMSLVYIDDVVATFLACMDGAPPTDQPCHVDPGYSATVGEIASQIQAFRDCRDSLVIDRVGSGLGRALYATYVSSLPTSQFAYRIAKYEDSRGEFVEMLKTRDSGQFSCFTAHPGVTRGGHYHHTKTEKFLVIRGRALFKFKDLITGERFELRTSGDNPEIVETVPGWAHDITNVGDMEMIVMLWANEIFDRAKPDTYSHKI